MCIRLSESFSQDSSTKQPISMELFSRLRNQRQAVGIMELNNFSKKVETILKQL